MMIRYIVVLLSSSVFLIQSAPMEKAGMYSTPVSIPRSLPKVRSSDHLNHQSSGKTPLGGASPQQTKGRMVRVRSSIGGSSSNLLGSGASLSSMGLTGESSTLYNYMNVDDPDEHFDEEGMDVPELMQGISAMNELADTVPSKELYPLVEDDAAPQSYGWGLCREFVLPKFEAVGRYNGFDATCMQRDTLTFQMRFHQLLDGILSDSLYNFPVTIQHKLGDSKSLELLSLDAPLNTIKRAVDDLPALIPNKNELWGKTIGMKNMISQLLSLYGIFNNAVVHKAISTVNMWNCDLHLPSFTIYLASIAAL
jgi:hypothetical protein